MNPPITIDTTATAPAKASINLSTLTIKSARLLLPAMPVLKPVLGTHKPCKASNPSGHLPWPPEGAPPDGLAGVDPPPEGAAANPKAAKVFGPATPSGSPVIFFSPWKELTASCVCCPYCPSTSPGPSKKPWSSRAFCKAQTREQRAPWLKDDPL